MNQIADAAWAAWRFPWWTWMSLVLTAALYVRGFIRVHRHMPLRFPVSGLVLYSAGILALAFALASPLLALDDRLLSTHMMQHLVLLMVAPPLLLLGAPQIPVVRAIPPLVAKKTLGLLAKSHRGRKLFKGLTHPVTGLVLFSTVILGWHLPGPFQAALRSEEWHLVEHGCMLLAGVLFWYPVVRPWPAAEQWSRWALVPYLLVADGVNSLLAAFMIFSGRLLYPSYASLPRLGGISAINDQIVAGAIMWVPGSILLLVAAIAIVMGALRPHTLTRPGTARYTSHTRLVVTG
ncbi:MAG: cytochrome c oxidase assembly protein [Deltaproteobacteria bacterium]|nr:cytochrome c oxidase assembly protein [Deltaproteobacteria bacterium]